MTKTLSCLRASAAAALLCLGLSAQAADLVLTPDSVVVNVGQSFVLDVNGGSFAGNIIGGGFNLSWDPARLSLSARSVDASTWPDPARNAGLLDAASGTLSGVFFNSNAAVLPTGSFHVAQLEFTALSRGISQVQLLGNPGLPFANDLAEAVDVNFGLATINAVPEPGSWALMGLGLAAVVLRRRQRQD